MKNYHAPDEKGFFGEHGGLYVAVFIAILSKLFYMESVIAIGAGRAALTMNLLPVFGALVGAAAFPDERLGGYVLTALILVAAGIAASEWGAARKRALESAE